MATQTEKLAAPGVGIALGYFLAIYGVHKGWIQEDDKAEAVGMAGFVVTWVLFQLKQVVLFFAEIIRSRFSARLPTATPRRASLETIRRSQQTGKK